MSALCPRPESQTRSAARVFRLRICSAELTGKQTTGKRTPDQEPHLFGFQERNEFTFEVATGNGVVGLERVEARQILELGNPERPGDLPRLPVGDADIADLALNDQRVEGAQGFLDRSHEVVGMDLVEIDVVRLEPPQAGFDGVHNVSTRSTDVIATGSDAPIDLRGYDDFFAWDVEILE